VRIAKPLLLVTTPLGLIDGVYECYKLAGGLVFIMLAMVTVMLCALLSVVLVIRREERQRRTTSPPPSDPVRPALPPD
jgi:hypothetical protein